MRLPSCAYIQIQIAAMCIDLTGHIFPLYARVGLSQAAAAGPGKAHLQDNIEYLYTSLKSLYRRSFLPLEDHYSYQDFFSTNLTDTDIEAKPFVLLLGQYSVGKTSFINHLLGNYIHELRM